MPIHFRSPKTLSSIAHEPAIMEKINVVWIFLPFIVFIIALFFQFTVEQSKKYISYQTVSQKILKCPWQNKLDKINKWIYHWNQKFSTTFRKWKIHMYLKVIMYFISFHKFFFGPNLTNFSGALWYQKLPSSRYICFLSSHFL